MEKSLVEEIMESRRKNKAFRETELGELFEKFVFLHSVAWQSDERYEGDHRSTKAWDNLAPVEKKLREKLMEIVGVK